MNERRTIAVQRSDIARGLRELGLKSGDLVVVHSSLRAFGYVEGGADAVLDALLDVLGPSGTLLLPSHNDVPEYSVGMYNPSTTPVRKNIGRIPETFWRRPGVLRGRHPPRHPWAGQGPLAHPLIALSESRPVGSQHRSGMLNAVADLGGFILLLGCGHNSSTTVHGAQAAAYNAVEGTTKRRAEFMEDFNAVEAPLRQAGVMRIGQIGEAEVRLMLSSDLFRVVLGMYATTYRGKAFKVEDYTDEAGFMPAAEYTNVLAAMRTRGT